VQFTGWAYDPDAPRTNVVVSGYLDGHWVSSAPTSVVRPGIAAQYQTGPTPGFALKVPVPNDGATHVACAVARHVGAGIDTVLQCSAVPLGRSVSSAARSPFGALTWAYAWTGSSGPVLHLKGWATDPDDLSRRLVYVVYVDGASTYTGATWSLDTVTAGSSAGPYSDFDVLVPTSSSAHVACVWVVNVGLGANKSLGCRGLDPRGGAGTGPVPTPAANQQAVAEAKKHLGQQYVWGAAGPTTFDCSGLVSYAYAKAGISLVHQSALQQQRARVIPQSRAVPGDLVFYHDGTGSVYHVGIYLGGNLTVAAIDEQQGVDYQTIWDPASATFGSVTHT
jgi:cell wall-associated NlpC family hydrolase